MPPLAHLEPQPEVLAAILARFGLEGEATVCGPGTGTASRAAVIAVGDTRLYLKLRNPRYCAPQWMWYDAEVAWRLQETGLPVAPPLRASDGRPWVEVGEEVYQVSPLLGGRREDTPSPAQLREVGSVLRRWHEATRAWRPRSRKPVGRLHDPADALQWLEALLGRARESKARVLREARDWVRRAAAEIPDQAYWELPQVVVQGDVHPANVHFAGDRVVGVFDYDWVCQAPRLTDLADAVIYMAGRRPAPIRDGDIRSLTQAFTLDEVRVSALMAGYGEGLADAERRAMGWLIVCRWTHARADAARRKIPEDERVSYVVQGLLRPLEEVHRVALRLWGHGLAG